MLQINTVFPAVLFVRTHCYAVMWYRARPVCDSWVCYTLVHHHHQDHSSSSSSSSQRTIDEKTLMASGETCLKRQTSRNGELDLISLKNWYLVHVAVSTQYQVCDRRMDRHFLTAFTAILYITLHLGLWSPTFYLVVTEGHSNWYHSKDKLRFHICRPRWLWLYLASFPR